ncbi:MAG: VWA domain-containing protein [bacterium]|nr:VWA domain-containing protein [bacterium]
MRKSSITGFLFLLFFLTIQSQLVSQDKRFITFYATTEGKVGHAFVSFVREDPALMQTTMKDGTWGLYPANKIAGGASFFIGEVPGAIRDDLETRPDVGKTIEVSKKEYQEALSIRDKWKNISYELTEKDCISFVEEVAKVLDHKLNIPYRELFDSPSEYIIKLKELNREYNPNVSSNGLIPPELCQYQALLDSASTPDECELRKELYKKLLGIATELGAYRRMYIHTGDLINLFPTVYYHMTVIEMNNIRRGQIRYSVDKMRQMIYFFDAYEFNRVQHESTREEHWRRHFAEVNAGGSYDFCQSFRKVMTSAIRAHLRFDLARAIRHAYDFSNSDSPVFELKAEFEATNSIFGLAQEKALDDISQITSCADLSNFNFRIFGGITLKEIKEWRMEAFDKALVNRVTLPGYGGPLISQPSYYPHTNYTNLGSIACEGDIPECRGFKSILFLFDLSGSMNDNGGGTIPKIEQAKNASKQTLDALRSNNQGVINQVAAYGFKGACIQDPTTRISPFDDDLDAVEQKISTMSAGGGTPLGNAIRAAECKMAAHLQKEKQEKGKIILLSDGQGTCGSIRPAGVYNSAPLQRNRHIMVDTKQCGGGMSNVTSSYVSYYTVGFNIPPGSPAERDLQYLSQLSGGKYLNVQNQTQLTRAFRKFNRAYQPKRYPKLSSLPSASTQTFSEGVKEIREEYFDDALEHYTQFVKDHPEDCHGVYNLAISQEASDYMKEAINNYNRYLSLCPSATDRAFVEKQIKFLEEEFRDFVIFQKEVVQSDLAFLQLHFDRIQNGQSVALAEEFKGFLREKGNYYERLPRLIASDDPFLEGITEEVSSALLQCKSLIRRNPEKWDQDAIPLISMTYLNLKDLLEEL